MITWVHVLLGFCFGFFFPLEKQHLFWKKWLEQKKYQVGEQTSFCRSCFKQAGGRFLILCLEIWQCSSRSLPEEGFKENLFSCALFPGCRSDPGPGWCHPLPLASLPLVLSVFRVQSKGAGERFQEWVLLWGRFLENTPQRCLNLPTCPSR